MPKERINSSTPNSNELEVIVGWSPDRDVQVGVEFPSTTVATALYGNAENVTRIGTALSEALIFGGWIPPKLKEFDSPDENYPEYWIGTKIINLLDDDAYKGLWSLLSREDCNRLIKVVRRARDQAYGRDE